MALYIVATPIGNLGDMSARAIEVLKAADAIYAEDTRNSSTLCRRFGIETRLFPYHDHSGDEVRADLIRRLSEGGNFALISDAGTPCISDPGYKLVRDARDAGIEVIPIPGASAVVAFLSAAGLPTDRFLFAGFMPNRTVARRERLEELLALSMTVVAYESPNRLEETLRELEALSPQTEVVVARELTKLYETWVRGSAKDVREALDAAQGWRGEIVLGFHPPAASAPSEGETEAWVDALLEAGLSPRSVSELLQARLGLNRKEVYRLALDRRPNET